MLIYVAVKEEWNDEVCRLWGMETRHYVNVGVGNDGVGGYGVRVDFGEG
jgi:hypothetical protein